MSDLISRQAAIDAADKIIERDASGSNAVVNAMIAWSEYIKALPSAQPTATWIIHKWGDDAQCSNCGRSFKDVYDMDNHDQYCRHCGTHMKGIKAI